MRKSIVGLAAWTALLAASASGSRAQSIPPTALPIEESSPPLSSPHGAAEGGSTRDKGEDKDKDKSKKRSPPGPPKIHLEGEEHQDFPPGLRGATQVLGRKATAKVSGASLKVKMTETTASYCAVLCPGTALASMRLVRPFAIEPAEGASRWVRVSLSAQAEGYLRTEDPGAAGLRLAAVALYPSACSPPPPPLLSLSLPPVAIGPNAHLYYRHDTEASPAVLPAGDYVLVLDFHLEAAVSDHLHGFAGATFSSRRPSTQLPNRDPFEKVDTKDFGFTAVLKAESIKDESK